MQKLTRERFGLYVILTDPLAGYVECARAAVEAGVKYLQLRMKNVPDERFLQTARALREITHGSETLFIVNDNLEVAMAAGADGLHLGQDDLPLETARRQWRVPGKIFGLSTHNAAQAARAIQLQPDYIGVGPVFPTPTKAKPDPVLGLQAMSEIIRSCPLAAVAIGGIDAQNLEQVLARGAVNFCAVRAITQSPTPLVEIHRLQKIWQTAVPSAPSQA